MITFFCRDRKFNCLFNCFLFEFWVNTVSYLVFVLNKEINEIVFGSIEIFGKFLVAEGSIIQIGVYLDIFFYRTC